MSSPSCRGLGRPLRLVVQRELYAADNGCRVMRVAFEDDASGDDDDADCLLLPACLGPSHRPRALAVKQVSFASPEGPTAVVHEAALHLSLGHDDVLRCLHAWTGPDVATHVDDEDRADGKERLIIEVGTELPGWHEDGRIASRRFVDQEEMLASAEQRGHGFLYLLLDLARGTLWEALGVSDETSTLHETGDDDSGRPGEERLWRWTLQTARALAYLHSEDVGVVHRDVNPWNIYILRRRRRAARWMSRSGEEEENAATGSSSEGGEDEEDEEDAVLADFGMAAHLPRPPPPPLDEGLPKEEDGAEKCRKKKEDRLLCEGAAPMTSSARASMYSAPELGGASDAVPCGYGAPADVFSWGLTFVAAWTSARGEAATASDVVAAVEAVRAAGDLSVLPSTWGCCMGCRTNRGGRVRRAACRQAEALRDAVGRAVCLAQEKRPRMSDVVRALRQWVDCAPSDACAAGEQDEEGGSAGDGRAAADELGGGLMGALIDGRCDRIG